MITVSKILELRAACQALPRPLGFVPTMGYLHEGHLSLVRRAREDCASVLTSIFVNPTQFGPQEDLEVYPREISRDLRLLEAEKVDLVWNPSTEEIYPEDYQTWVTVEEVTKSLEGAVRPGHFRGVATIVAKLFNCVQPDRAYFGQKDAQQGIVVQRMVTDLNFPVEIVVCPTVREEDGLAMSSRNVYLKQEERKAATVLYQALLAAEEAYRSGNRDAESLRRIMANTIGQESLANLQYASCADPTTLREIHDQVETALLSVAVYIGKTHLIDNIILGQ